MIQLFQKYAKTLYFRQAFRQKKNRLKIALQVSKLGFSPIVIVYRGETSRLYSRLISCFRISAFIFSTADSMEIQRGNFEMYKVSR